MPFLRGCVCFIPRDVLPSIKFRVHFKTLLLALCLVAARACGVTCRRSVFILLPLHCMRFDGLDDDERCADSIWATTAGAYATIMVVGYCCLWRRSFLVTDIDGRRRGVGASGVWCRGRQRLMLVTSGCACTRNMLLYAARCTIPGASKRLIYHHHGTVTPPTHSTASHLPSMYYATCCALTMPATTTPFLLLTVVWRCARAFARAGFARLLAFYFRRHTLSPPASCDAVSPISPGAFTTPLLYYTTSLRRTDLLWCSPICSAFLVAAFQRQPVPHRAPPQHTSLLPAWLLPPFPSF